MSFITLPEEIFIIIIRELDLKSVNNLYNTCRHARNIVSMHGVLKECHMSLNTMATARSLKLNFFKDVSGHLLVLNMCGVHDLYKTSLLPAMKKLKNLKTLNVAYTNITMQDFLELHQVCPTIVDVTINFNFSKAGNQQKMTPENIIQFQNLFRDFVNIHFVGSTINLLESGLAPRILQEAKLNSLKFSVAERHYSPNVTDYEKEIWEVQFNQFKVYILNWKDDDVYHGNVLNMFDIRSYEYVIILAINFQYYSVYVSPLFKTFFKDNFGIDGKIITDINLMNPLMGNVAMMVWKKQTTSFNDTFYSNLLTEVNDLFPCNYEPYLKSKSRTNLKNNWFYLKPALQGVEENDLLNNEPEFKKRRVAPPCVVLNYDELLNGKRQVQLNLVFDNTFRNTVTLSPNCNYLRKLTFLSLSGPVRYSGEFFNILFRCCDNLVTLNLEASPIFSCAAPISRSIPLSQTLKNLRLVDRRIDFKTLFSSLSQCKTLENIQIHDVSTYNILADPSLVFEKCDNLYYFFVYASMAATARTKKSQMIKKSRARCGKPHLNFELLTDSSSNRYNYEPFIEVFKLNPIKEPS